VQQTSLDGNFWICYNQPIISPLGGKIPLTKLLLRLFVRDYQNTELPAVRAAIGKLAGITGIVCNVLLFALKLTVGLLSGAVSVIADALNNLSDAASSVVTLLGFRLAQRPADKTHPYGHARYEYLSGLTVAALILVIGFELAKSSVSRILPPQLWILRRSPSQYCCALLPSNCG
jgi:hypothetical protein